MIPFYTDICIKNNIESKSDIYRRWRQMRSLSLEMCQRWWIVRHVCENQPLFVIVLAENLIFA